LKKVNIGVGCVVGVALLAGVVISMNREETKVLGTSQVSVKKDLTHIKTLEIKKNAEMGKVKPLEFSDSSGVKPKFSNAVYSVEVAKGDVQSSVAEKPKVTSRLEDLGVSFESLDSLPEPEVRVTSSVLGKSQREETPYRPSAVGDVPLAEDVQETPEVVETEYYGVKGSSSVFTASRDKPSDDRLELMGAFLSTAYDLSYQSCGKYPSDVGYGNTAGGVSLIGKTRESARAVAVDPSVIPLGSKLYIEFPGKYKNFTGVYTAIDTGSAIKRNHIDLFMGDFNNILPDPSVAEFGRQGVIVYKVI
jgi:3D (Asp-Asp-Asp) domain-containing protein